MAIIEPQQSKQSSLGIAATYHALSALMGISLVLTVTFALSPETLKSLLFWLMFS